FVSKLNRFEDRWQQKWQEAGIHETEADESKEKYYVLEMFPYPSGDMHMGHVRNYSIGDAFARYRRMQGYNVIYPMGWDSFGLPAENAAIDRDVNPREWTEDCIQNMKKQLKTLGLSYDWRREVATYKPEYYRWNQWIFLKMLEEDLAYRGESEVNWCPGCETVLADEQVEDGLCWRCDSVVEKKDMKQWFLGITDYSDQLLDELDTLEGWPDKVKKMQRDWIGKSHGATIEFPLEDGGDLEVFTTRPDTIYGATFMALAPEHPLAEEIAEENDDVSEYISEAKKRDSEEREEKTKSGVFTGRYAVNPLNGEEIPVYVAEFVLTDYGTGAIMAVPAHDQRDFEFAREHGIDIKPVIEPEEEHDFDEEAYEGDGKHVDSGEINGLYNEEAKEEIIEILEQEDMGKPDVNYKLRDWLISRQRYWGTPIPVVYCDECGVVPVPEEDLPVELPEDVEFTGQGNPIETSDTFIETECPDCGGSAERETDTMDTFVGSSWYFLRYCSPDFEEAPFDTEAANYWMNVDQYIGGIEHAVMHLLYARFFTKFFRDIDMLDQDEPFERLLTQGMVNHPAYNCPEHGWIYPEEVEENSTCTRCGSEVEVEVMKMSKSKNNVVDPNELIEDYGADTARLFILRASHPAKELDWSSDGVEASKEMLERVARLVDQNRAEGGEPDISDSNLQDRIAATRIQRTIEKVTEHMENYEFNLAINELDKLLSKLFWYSDQDPDEAVMAHGIEKFIQMLAPFSPHISEQIWQEELEKSSFLVETEWPEPQQALVDEEAEIIDEYHDRVASDIREIEELYDGEPSTIKLIRADSWKYEAERRILEQVKSGNHDIGSIMDQILDEELKQHASEISSMTEEAAENPGKFEKRFTHEETESEALRQNRERWEDEFSVDVTTEREQDSDEEKASRAEPGRPAIVIE
ncbi:MAG: leucine--tRNA ligase, partial [Candidatus Nanohaloarchaea archaeon]